MEWQPIETAPKDANYIILLHGLPTKGIFQVHRASWNNVIKKWEWWIGNTGWNDKPLGWLPYPDPPQSNEASQ